MLVDLSRDHLPSDVASGALPAWVTSDAHRYVIAGDDSLARETYLAVTADRVLVGTDLPEVVGALRQNSEVSVSHEGVSQILGSGFAPLPITILDGVYRIGAGDKARFAIDEGAPIVEFENDYPWLLAKSRQDVVPDTDRLHELIVASLQRHLDKWGRQGLLMLSSGKDSMALAVALADIGYDVPCVTYRAGTNDTEHEHAAAFCRKLGLAHETIDMPRDPVRIRRYLTSFFEGAVVPSADHATIPYVATVAESGVRRGALIDGGGNDGYMGYFASRRRRKKTAFRIRGKRLQTIVARSTRIDSRLNYLARTRSAAAWPGRNMRFHEIQPVYAAAIDPAERWRQEDRRFAGWSDVDRAAANMLRQIEGARTPDKARLVAHTHGMQAVMPFCDPDLAEYAFHLPVDQRYVERIRADKVPLRQLLEERIDYDPRIVGDGFFAFEGASFFADNADFVREEVFSCALWEPAVRPMVDAWLAVLDQRPYLFHALLSLFMVSGWHNHSLYLAA